MKSKVRAILNPKFKEHCEQLGLTQIGVANATGVTRQYVSQIWQGEALPSKDFAATAIVAGLAKSFDDVLIIPDSTSKATTQDVAA